MIPFLQDDVDLKDFFPFTMFSRFCFHSKGLVAGLHLCQINTSGCRLTLEREWRSRLWPPREGTGAPTGWPATSSCSVTAGGTGSSIGEKKASRYVPSLRAVCLSMDYTSYFMLLQICQIEYRDRASWSTWKCFQVNIRHVWHFKIRCPCIIYEISRSKTIL